MKNKKLSLKTVIIPLVLIIVYFVSEYLLIHFGKINVPNYLKFVVIILCILVAGYNAYKQNKN